MNRKHELFLINLGLETLLNQAMGNKEPDKVVQLKRRKWSASQHKKFSASMKKIWEAKKKQALK